MRAKKKYCFVFIDNSGFDSETECKRMTGDEIREEFKGIDFDQMGVAIVDGNLVKGFETIIDLSKL